MILFTFICAAGDESSWIKKKLCLDPIDTELIFQNLIQLVF